MAIGNEGKVSSPHDGFCDCCHHEDINEVLADEDLKPLSPSELPLQVLQTPAGYYVGTQCDECGPFDRKTDYCVSYEIAERILGEILKGNKPIILRSPEYRKKREKELIIDLPTKLLAKPTTNHESSTSKSIEDDHENTEEHGR